MLKRKLYLISVFMIIFLTNILFAEQEKPHIVVLATGGGIAGSMISKTESTFTVANITAEALLFQLPETGKIAKLSAHQIAQVGSQNMTYKIWFSLGNQINDLLSQEDVDGIVITHGTDSIEETAYFLNLVINHHKPIILVGATRPYNHLSPDGPSNLFDAIKLAASPSSHYKGVLICMNGKIVSARHASKYHTYNPDSIDAPSIGLLGYIYGNKIYYYQESIRKHTYKSIFNLNDIKTLAKVEIVYLSVETNPSLIDFLVKKGYQGIVIAGVGNGNVSDKVLQKLISARKKGVTIVRSSRTGNGIVTQDAEIDDQKYGFITANNLNPQKAKILLQLALNKSKDIKVIQEIFDTY